MFLTTLGMDIGLARAASQAAKPRLSPPRSTGGLAPGPVAALSIILPTYNQRANLEELIARIAAALPAVRWEVIVVDDDSPDIGKLALVLHEHDPRIRVIRRAGRRGLASACIEGMLASNAPYLAVMEADLQHDPALLGMMLDVLMEGETDLVIASRHVDGGLIEGRAESRAMTSWLATWLAHGAADVQLTDPMSGFFALRRRVIDRWAPNLSAIGFKILLDIIMTAGPSLRIREVPLRFVARAGGRSELTPRVAWDHAMMLADKMFGHVVPVRLFSFACVGTIGLVVHLTALTVLFGLVGMAFVPAEIAATILAMICNYAVNNLLTYADRAKRGWAWIAGLACFLAVCAIGAIANVLVAAAALDIGMPWEIAAVAGILTGMVWNYGASAQYTWPAKP